MALVLSGDSPSISGTYQGGVVTSGTAVASTSGTSIDFTGIPSWVKRITVMLTGVSTNGTSAVQVQIGAGSITTSGYISTGCRITTGTTSAANSTSAFIVNTSPATSEINSGLMVIANAGSNNWVASFNGKSSTALCVISGGDIALGGTLDRIRITTANGTDTFDAGSINILYE